MTNLVSDIVRYRARSVISRYLFQRGVPTVMLSPIHSTGVHQFSSVTETAHPVSATQSRTRFPPLADDYDLHSLNVTDLLDYLSELSFSRELKLATARCDPH